MGQQKGNPIPSFQNQGYETLRPNTNARIGRDLGTKPVMIDDTTTLDELIDSGSLQFTSGYVKDSDLINGLIDASFNTITANEYHVTIYTSSILFANGSNNFGNTEDDIHNFVGDVTISGSLFVSGTTEFGGDLIPKSARGATLGTEERPFSEIFVSSGSINIASDTIGEPNTSISNDDGNLLISAGGMRLIGDASFIAATGSFSFISGSMTQVGDYTLVGDKTISGSLTVSASVNINNGFYVDGNKQFNYGLFSDLTTQSGSANIAYPMKLNTTDLASGFSIVDDSRITAENTGIYNLQFSTQIDQTTNNTAELSIWVRKNGTNVPNSNTEISIEKSGKLVAAWNYIVQLNASQYVELMWSSTSSDTQLHFHNAQSTPTRPATPSVIVTMTQIA